MLVRHLLAGGAIELKADLLDGGGGLRGTRRRLVEVLEFAQVGDVDEGEVLRHKAVLTAYEDEVPLQDAVREDLTGLRHHGPVGCGLGVGVEQVAEGRLDPAMVTGEQNRDPSTSLDLGRDGLELGQQSGGTLTPEVGQGRLVLRVVDEHPLLAVVEVGGLDLEELHVRRAQRGGAHAGITKPVKGRDVEHRSGTFAEGEAHLEGARRGRREVVLGRIDVEGLVHVRRTSADFPAERELARGHDILGVVGVSPDYEVEVDLGRVELQTHEMTS